MMLFFWERGGEVGEGRRSTFTASRTGAISASRARTAISDPENLKKRKKKKRTTKN